MDDDRFVDAIYESAVIVDNWRVVLDGLAELGGGLGTVCFCSSANRVTNVFCSEAIADFIGKWTSSRWVDDNERGKRLIPIREPRFLTDLDAFAEDELATTSIYRDFYWPNGLGWCAGTAIHSPTGESVVFSIERSRAKGPVEAERISRLDQIRPHLARAASLSARAAQGRFKAAVLSLELVGLPAAVLSASGKIIAANGLFANDQSGIRIGAGDKLSFAQPGAQEAFAAVRSVEGMSGSFALPPADGSGPAVIHMMPLRGNARDVFSGAATLAYVTKLMEKSTVPNSILEALFDLTPAESRVAKQVGIGLTVQEVARMQRVNPGTVRAQLKSIFVKTGVRRQAELSRLLAVSTLVP